MTNSGAKGYTIEATGGESHETGSQIQNYMVAIDSKMEELKKMIKDSHTSLARMSERSSVFQVNPEKAPAEEGATSNGDGILPRPRGQEVPTDPAEEEGVRLKPLLEVKFPIPLDYRELSKRSVSFLVDIGATHSFIDHQVAKELGCLIQDDVPLRVTIADGNQVISHKSCPNISWKISGLEFAQAKRL